MSRAPMSAVAINRLVVGNVKDARRRLGVDQTRFALALGIPKHRLCDIEAGAEVFGCDLIVKAAETLGMEVRALFADPAEARA